MNSGYAAYNEIAFTELAKCTLTSPRSDRLGYNWSKPGLVPGLHSVYEMTVLMDLLTSRLLKVWSVRRSQKEMERVLRRWQKDTK